MNKVCIAISTYGERINSIMIPAPRVDVCYLIVHQRSAEVAITTPVQSILGREDVRYVRLDSVGLSRSRNCALKFSESDYVHIMDDDVEINSENISHLAEIARKQKADIALGHFRYENGRSSKQRETSGVVGLKFIFSVCSIEMCISRAAIESGITFDERFGLGTPNPSGEEFIFLKDAKQKSLSIHYYPVCIGTHPNITSGDDFFSTEDKIYAKRNMFDRAFPRTGSIFKLLFFIKKAPILIENKVLFRFFYKFML